MGNKDKTRDENAATSSEESRDTALARTITQAVAEAFAMQKTEETKLITETFTRQMEKTQVQYEELLKASRAQNFPSTLKVTLVLKVSGLWIHSIGLMTKTSTRDGSFGL